MQVNEQAPLVARSETQIDASAEAVWAVMADIEQWPAWNPDVKSAALEGPLAAGTAFRWKSGPSNITSTLREVDAPRTIAWTGRQMGIEAVHIWRIESRDGGSLVVTEESWNGFPVRLLFGLGRKMLQNALDSGLRHLKAEAERRAGAAAPGS
jgi:uncharacterized protein YndB with AHSA1/START domain